MKPKFTGASAGPRISTRAELLQRLAQRPKPQVQQRLEPDGAIKSLVQKQTNRSLEKRISELRSSLSKAKSALQRDRALGMAKGQSKAGFDRSR